MLVSDIKLFAGNTVHIETLTDAYRVLRDETARQNYITDFGDVAVVYDATCDVYRVPAHAERIANYTDLKARDCAIWGCE